MSTPELTGESAGRVRPPALALERITGHIAVLGGLLALAVAMLATASVVMRWLFDAPIDGDFEYVKMATAVAVFAYLPYTQARRGNVMVDTFTGWLPEAARNLLDAFWDLVFAGLLGYLAYCLFFGTIAAFVSGETTMQRQLVLWPSIALCTLLAALLAMTAVATALHLIHAAGSGRAG